MLVGWRSDARFAPVSNRSRWLLGTLCVWTVFIWGNRVSNAWSSTTETTSAKVVSTLLAASFLVLAAGGLVVLVRSWGTGLSRAAASFLLVFAGWTIAVWCVRIVSIAVVDHGVAFKVVHALLGLISIGLAVAVGRDARRVPVDAISTVG
jgi:hypothetical protein